MKKIYLDKVSQKGTVFYIGKVDPRILVRLTDNIQVGETQDAQRPLEKKHLQEISKYVGEDDGILPSSILIATKQMNKNGKKIEILHEMITIQDSDGNSGVVDRSFMLVPENDAEFSQYEGTIDTIDGQHRLFSFRLDFVSPLLKDDEPYEMTFALFETPSINLRRQLFITTNEKQKAVSPNLILWLRESLGLIDQKEKKYLDLVKKLNEEEYSPLKGRIIMSAEKITKGYKAKEVVKILKKALPESNQLLEEAMPDTDLKAQVISNYLRGWESYYGLSFQRPKNDTMTKISGLRYILWWFPTFCEEAIEQDKKINDSFVKGMIEEIEDSISPNSIFDISSNFRGEGATDRAVKDHIGIWKMHHMNNKKQRRSSLI